MRPRTVFLFAAIVLGAGAPVGAQPVPAPDLSEEVAPELPTSAPAVPAPAPTQPQFLLPETVTPIEDPRPLRFIMQGGNVVVGRRVGEDPEFFWIILDQRLARVRKSDVASMDYRAGRPVTTGAAVVEGRAGPPPPLDVGPSDFASRRPRGRGLVIGGGVLFGLFYAGSALAAPDADGAGGLLLLPIVGPVVYGVAEEANGDDMGVLALVSILQAGGALMLYFGIKLMIETSRQDEEARRPSIALTPELAPEAAGLRVSGAF